uniref:Regulatory protein zeste n=1 Tax=Anopheles atroparvus TaxID=41427 RepID=A0AAG5CWM7_ANOAO
MEWKRAWVEKKYSTKRKFAENKKQNQSGGRAAKFSVISDFDKRVFLISKVDKCTSGKAGWCPPVQAEDVDPLEETPTKESSDKIQSIGSRATKIQHRKLIDMLEQNPELANGSKRHTFSFWQQVASALNSLGPPTKTAMEWKRAWMEKKYATKRKLAEYKKQNQPGAQFATNPGLSELDERVLLISKIDKSTSGTPEPCTPEPCTPEPCVPEPCTLVQEEDEETLEDTKPWPSMLCCDEQQPAGSTKNVRKGCEETTEKDFKEILIQQNDQMLQTMGQFMELARTFVDGTLKFQKELLNHLKKT